MLEKMMDDIINKYGFEAKETIRFCHDCEIAEQKITGVLKEVEKWYKIYMEK